MLQELRIGQLQWAKKRKHSQSRGFCIPGPVMPADDEDDGASSIPHSRAGSQENGSSKPLAGFKVLEGNLVEKTLPNGDLYIGDWVGNQPEGKGRYIWKTGCVYEGDWQRGKGSGRGKLLWPNGAVYEGMFSGGYRHGQGTFRSADGSTYKGAWSMNKKHGIGKMKYANGEKFEGSWKNGVREGYGKYVWCNKNFYVGDWKSGVMTGKGVLRWAMGDAYNGEWLNGLEHGKGVYYWQDGGIFIGTWSRGLKDGKGVFYPPGSLPADLHSRESLMYNKVEEFVATGKLLGHLKTTARQREGKSMLASAPSENLDQQMKRNVWLGRRWSLEGPLERVLGLDSLSQMMKAEDFSLDSDKHVSPILEREYAQGVLINEFVKNPFGVALPKSVRKKTRRQPREPKRPGETIFKGHRSYDLMLSLQLGIRYTVGKASPSVNQHTISALDFGTKASVRMKFPKMGSSITPCHKAFDFAWKDYCPKVFTRLRDMFKIDPADYMLSICGNSALRELSSPGKSGSVFFLSHDDRFMIKTMRKSEVKVLLRMLRSYYNHVCAHENTLITKFFGLHRVKPHGGQKVRFVVMGNMFCTDLRIHRRYDLKGSLQGRSTDKADIDESTTLKDLDLDFAFHLEPAWREALITQISLDCKFLESQHIMDYSLLLGLHFRAPQFNGVMESVPDDAEWTPARGLVLVPREKTTSSLGMHIRGRPLKTAGSQGEEVDLLLPGTARLQIQLGVNMPARADKQKPGGLVEEDAEEYVDEVYDVVLYLGMIDILQEYDMGKKLEHAYKSLQFDPLSISAVEPKSYSKRFQDFICKIFPDNNYFGAG